jgi:hypothetical protein
VLEPARIFVGVRIQRRLRRRDGDGMGRWTLSHTPTPYTHTLGSPQVPGHSRSLSGWAI